MRNSAGPVNRIQVVDALRGVAAAMVALFHFTHGNPRFPVGGALGWLGSIGFAGVDVFFVISGFIVPWSLSRSDYRLRNFVMYMARRIVRLDPPYLVSLVLVIALSYASSITPGFAGTPFAVSWPRLLLHVGYLNGFFGYEWYNDVYWTLAIELQFYILIGLLFPVLVSTRRHLATVALSLIALPAVFATSLTYLPAWIFPFVMGIIVFRYRMSFLSPRLFIVQLALATLGVFATLGVVPAIEALFASLVIAYISLSSHAILEFFGLISYSLYLVHIPIGGRVINLAVRMRLDSTEKAFVILTAFAVSVAAAYLLNRFVERPAQEWARRFKSPIALNVKLANTAVG